MVQENRINRSERWVCHPAKFLIPLVICLACAAEPLFASFWDTKNWKGWSELECDQLLAQRGVGVGSPWARETGGSLTGNGYTYNESILVQFRSAYPIRLALARIDQIQNKYGKLPPDGRAAVDQRIQTQLDQSFSEKSVLHIRFSFVEGGKRAAVIAQPNPEQAFLVFPDGRRVPSSEPESIVRRQDSVEYEVTFPRIAGGRPLLALSDKKFVVECRGATEFDASKMFFRGKLEY